MVRAVYALLLGGGLETPTDILDTKIRWACRVGIRIINENGAWQLRYTLEKAIDRWIFHL